MASGPNIYSVALQCQTCEYEEDQQGTAVGLNSLDSVSSFLWRSLITSTQPEIQFCPRICICVKVRTELPEDRNPLGEVTFSHGPRPGN